MTRRTGEAKDGTARARAARFVALGLLVSALAACTPLPLGDGGKVDTFDLTTPAVTTQAKGRPLQVLVPEPVVDRAYDTDRLLVRPSATEIAFYSGAQWSDRLPRLIQSRLVEALERSGRFRAAGRPGQGLAIDRQLIVDVRAFDYLVGERRVEVALAVKTMDDRTGRVASVVERRAEEPVASDTAKAVVAAFDAAFARVIGEIVADAGR
ncbi:MAG: ABC-type transport auxiliary lipoprotein family protein [Hyphomicrobiales bacterium]|nr:ABC-type transport auxiliary lipoprotein family protein [Hyphomicrobiales bacterium]